MKWLNSDISFNLLMLFTINVVISLTSEAVYAFFPLFLQSLGATVVDVGLVLTVSGLISSITMIPSGFLTDKYGRKTVITISVLLSASALFYTFTKSWMEAIPIAIIFTVASAIFVPARMAIVADYTNSKNRAMIYSLMNLAWPIGGIVGPTVAGFLADQYGWNEVFYFVTAFSLASLIPAFKVKEPKTAISERRIGEEAVHERFGSGEVKKMIALHTSIALFNGVARGMIAPIIPFYLTDKLQLNKTELGLFLSLSYGISVLASQPISGLLANKIGSKKTLILGSLLSPVAMAIFPCFDNFISLFLVYMAQYAFWSMSWPTSMTLLVGSIPSSKRGLASAVRTTGFRFGFYAGPMVGAYLWEIFNPTAPFYGAVLPLVLVVFFAFLVKDV